MIHRLMGEQVEEKSFGHFLKKAQGDLQMSLTLTTINEDDYRVGAPTSEHSMSFCEYLLQFLKYYSNELKICMRNTFASAFRKVNANWVKSDKLTIF